MFTLNDWSEIMKITQRVAMVTGKMCDLNLAVSQTIPEPFTRTASIWCNGDIIVKVALLKDKVRVGIYHYGAFHRSRETQDINDLEAMIYSMLGEATDVNSQRH